MNPQIKQAIKRFPLSKRLVGWYRGRITKGLADFWNEKIDNDRELLLAHGGRRSGLRILVATSTGAYQPALPVDTLLAVALLLRGVDVHILLCDAALPACQLCDVNWFANQKQFIRYGPKRDLCGTCYSPAAKLFRSIGLPVHTYGNCLNHSDRQWAKELADSIPRQEISHYCIDGIGIGEHATAGALRFYAKGSLEGEPLAEQILRRYFEASLLSYRSATTLLTQERFDCTVFHHGIYVPQGLIGEVCRYLGIHVVNWHIGYRDRSFIFSHEDTYHRTLMTEPIEHWDQMEFTARMEEQIVDYLRSRWKGSQDWIHFNRNPTEDVKDISTKLGIDFSKPCIGILTNVVWDAQLHYPANAFPNMVEWVMQTIRYFAKRPALQLIIRVHPAEVTGQLPSRQMIADEIRREFGILPRNVYLIPPESRISTYRLMLKCDSVVIYGTKTGVELACFGVPIVVAGEAWIRGKGFTRDVNSKEEYFEILNDLPCGRRMDAEQIGRARKYAYHFFFRRMIPLPFISQSSPGFQHYQVRLEKLADLMPGCDLGLDVICGGIMDKREFIYPAEKVSSNVQSGLTVEAR